MMLRILRVVLTVFGLASPAPTIPHAGRLALGGSITRRRRAGLRG